MAHLIDKDAALAEIENLVNAYKKCPTRNSYEDGLKDGRLIGYKDALHKINTLEVKEVDLEKEIDRELETRWRGEYLFTSKFRESAKHFFELGVRKKKEEKYEVPSVSKTKDVSVTSRMAMIDDDLKPIAEFILDYAGWNLHKDEWNHPVLEVPLFRVLDALIQRGKPYCGKN